MYPIKIDHIFEEYVKTFNASMLSLWAVSQQFFLKWVKQYEKEGMVLGATKDKASSILIGPIIAEIEKNNPENEEKGPFFTELVKNFCIIFCVAAFDRLQEDNRYEQIKNSPEIQFFRHIRNGCAHGNKFFFKTYTDKKTGEKIEEPTKKAGFRELVITRKLMDDNKNVFFDFFSAGNIPYLIEDVSKKLTTCT